jgi:hypothetical protein
MLGQHPQAYGVPELNLFTADTLDGLLEGMPGIRQLRMQGLLRVASQLYSGEQTLESLDLARRWYLNRLYCSTGDIYRELCQKVFPLRIIDKSPTYCTKRENLQRIPQAFPNACYLHLVRHPRTQGQSMVNISGGLMAILGNAIDYSTFPPTIDPQFWWYEMQCNILNFLKTIPADQQMRLRGEDILTHPRHYFQQICAWLHLDWSEEAFAAMLKPEESPFANYGPYTAHYGNDPNFLKSPHFRKRTIPPSHLEGPLPWRPDGKGLVPDVANLARALGYE